MSFFDEFNSITPYFVRVNVGKNKQFKIDPTKKSHSNHQGKLVAFYKKAKTLEELQKYGLGEYVEYLPSEQVSMPINIQVVSDGQITPVFEEGSDYTNKKSTRHTIRIFNNNKAQVGCIFISLTPSGDIYEKTCFYNGPSRNEQIMHTIYNNMNNVKLIKDEHFMFKKNDGAITKKIEISQREGKVVGAAVVEQDLETREDVAFQSITEFAKDEKTPKLKRYVASCVVDETERKKRGGTLIPWECMTLEDDLFEYQKAMDEFNEHVNWVKEKSGIEISLERAIEIGKLSYSKQREAGIPREFTDYSSYYCQKAKYLSDSSNDLMRNFKGMYIGNILRLTDKGYEGCIVTKHQKDEKNYRLYTLIDFAGTSITRGTGMDEYADSYITRDPNYFERLRNCDKVPTFITTVEENGNEELVLYKGSPISEECPEYNDFIQNFIAPFSEIKPIQISKLLNKENEKGK